jgi:hypothetical protein
MNIYHVQDNDRPMFVIASSWDRALRGWRQLIQEENPEADMSDVNPDGITFVAESNDILQVADDHNFDV